MTDACFERDKNEIKNKVNINHQSSERNVQVYSSTENNIDWIVIKIEDTLKSKKKNDINQSKEVELHLKIMQGIDSVFEEICKKCESSVHPRFESLASLKNLKNPKHRSRAIIELDKIDQLTDRILYIEAQTPYCFMYLEQRDTLKLRIPIQIIEEYFEASGNLSRIHKSYVINTKKIVDLRKQNRAHIVLINDSNRNLIKLPVSTKYLNPLSKKFNK